jgi:hypothetical protein
MLYVQSWTPYDGRKDCPKHVEWYSINSKNCASSWFYYRKKIYGLLMSVDDCRCKTMHLYCQQMNIKSKEKYAIAPTIFGSFKADSHIACRAHAVPLPCRAAKGLECVFPTWFTQWGRVWFIKMWSVNQTRPHCLNQMGKTHSKPLAARHGRGTTWARHAMCESAFTGTYVPLHVS